MHIVVLKETADARVALSPDTVAKLVKEGHSVSVEAGAGEGAFFADAQYSAAGAAIGTRAALLPQADVLAAITLPASELAQLRPGAWAIGQINPADTELMAQLEQLPILSFNLNRIPRITLAQSMDVLSSMASMAGYRAVLVAAAQLPGYIPMMMTAAGALPPARVLVLGAGVAGLQAIATARRLGAVVEAFDVRSAVREEVESLGAKFIMVEGAAEDKAAGGYAIEQDEAYKQRQAALIADHASRADIIIATASIPGRQAPLLIHEETVKRMRPGSVVVDLAAPSGGNCAGTEAGKTVVKHGVTLIGPHNLPAEMTRDSSKLYSNNLHNFLKYLFKMGDQLDFSQEIVKSTCVKQAVGV